MSALSKRLLVVGGSGQLGKVILQRFVNAGWNTTNLDIIENSSASENLLWTTKKSWSETMQDVDADLEKKGEKFDCIVCAAGGFAMGNPGEKGTVEGSEFLLKVNLETAFSTTHFAAKYLHANGLTVMTGAEVVNSPPIPILFSYQATKCATHSLIRSLAEHFKSTGQSQACAAILPVTIDTPTNREAMPDADHSTWTPMEEFAEHILNLTKEEDSTSCNGLFYHFKTEHGITKIGSSE